MTEQLVEFSIRLLDAPATDVGRVAAGEIQIGDFIELFEVPLTYWDHQRYVAQWSEGARRLIAGAEKSALHHGDS